MPENKENVDVGAKTANKNAGSRRGQSKAKPWSKVVIRKLPPTMSESTFLDQIQPIPDHDYFYFMHADSGVNGTGRAYINFTRQEEIFIFKDKFDGYVFVDERGNEYPAVVEFAPFQKLVKHKSKRKDKKCDTYEKNEHFLKFLEFLETETDMPKLELKFDFDHKEDSQVRSTPLLEYLNNRRGDRNRRKELYGKKLPATILEDAVNIKLKPKDKGSKVDIPLPGGDKPTVKDNNKPERPERSEKEKARRAERDKMRREKRNQKFEEKRKERQLAKENGHAGGSATEKPIEGGQLKEGLNSLETVKQANPADKPKREVKKYSERRQENRKKQEDKVGGSNQKRGDGDGKPADKPKESKPDDKKKEGQSEKSESKKRYDRRSSEDKRKIKNKDRPSLQIYQPGKHRQGGSSKMDEGNDSPRIEDKSNTNTEATNV